MRNQKSYPPKKMSKMGELYDDLYGMGCLHVGGLILLWLLGGWLLFLLSGCSIDTDTVYYHSKEKCLVVEDRCYSTPKEYSLAEGISLQTAIDNFRFYQLEARKKDKMKKQLRKQREAYVNGEKRYDRIKRDSAIDTSNHNLSNR